MAEPSAPPLQDKSAHFSHQQQLPNITGPYAPLYPEPPPPYTPQDTVAPPGPTPAPPPSVPYPKQSPLPVMPTLPVQAPIQQAAPSPQATQVIVVGGNLALPPGTCTVCRKGKMKNSASFWTWLCCCLLLPFGILPGLCVFCCCCREPKCTNCGYSP